MTFLDWGLGCAWQLQKTSKKEIKRSNLIGSKVQMQIQVQIQVWICLKGKRGDDTSYPLIAIDGIAKDVIGAKSGIYIGE